MKYMGSKAGVAKYIVPILQKEIDRRHITTYVEPFCGGCNLLDKIQCDQKIASDINPYLIALLQYTQNVGRQVSAGGIILFLLKKHWNTSQAISHENYITGCEMNITPERKTTHTITNNMSIHYIMRVLLVSLQAIRGDFLMADTHRINHTETIIGKQETILLSRYRIC